MIRYWETETPVEVDTGKNVLRYFPQADKLQIAMPYWTNADGETKQGKTVALNISALLESDGETKMQAYTIFAGIAERLRG